MLKKTTAPAAAVTAMTSATMGDAEREKKRKRESTKKRLKRNGLLYLMLLPGVLYFIIFKYVPMGGLIIAFQDYQPSLGIFGSPFVGLKHFVRFFSDPTFFMLLKNTLAIFGLNLLFDFPLPIIVALMLNEVRNSKFKKGIQTLIYIPHFMSWVIVVSISFILLSVDGGVINTILAMFGINKIPFLTSPHWARFIYVAQDIWKGVGWGTIIYLASISAVDSQLYEAAEMDGAGKFMQMWHVTLPAIRPIIVIMLIMKIGNVLELGFEHAYLLLNSLNRNVMEIFDTYIYTAGLQNGQLSYSTVIGLFKGGVGFILVLMANKLAHKLGEEGLY